LEHLEFCLRKDPDHGPTLTLIDANKLPMNTPELNVTKDTKAEDLHEALRPWFKQTSYMARASQEIAVRDLLSNLDVANLQATLRSELVHRSSAHRALAALLMHRAEYTIEQKDVVQDLIKRAILDGSDDVRSECSRTLRDLEEEAITQPFHKALASTSPAIRTNAADALGTLGFVNSAAPLVSALAATSAGAGGYRPPAAHIFIGRQIAYVQDFDVEVAQGVAIAEPNVNVITEGVVLDVRLLSVRQEMVRVNERSALRGSLKKLLGQDFRYDSKKWAKWLEEHPKPE
jgi:hypothetical protein